MIKDMVKAREPKAVKLPPIELVPPGENDPQMLHKYLRRDEVRKRLRRIDYSLNGVRVETLEVVDELCQCAACKGKYKMCAWPGMDPRIWGARKPACVHRVMLQMSRLALLTKNPINVYIHTQIKERFYEIQF